MDIKIHPTTNILLVPWSETAANIVIFFDVQIKISQKE
jgi:hypothetical protein